MIWGTTKQRGLLIGVFSAIFYSCFLLLAPNSFLEKPCGDCNSLPENFLAGKGWVDDSGNFAHARPPGQPLMIIGLKKLSNILNVAEARVFILFNVLLLSVVAVLLFLIAKKVWGTDAVILVPIAWTTCPFVVWFLNQPYSEVPFFVFFFASILSFLRSLEADEGRLLWYALMTGILLGTTMLVRSIAIGLPIVMGVCWILLSKSRATKIRLFYLVALLFGTVVTVVPWSMTMYKETGQIHFLGPSILTANSIGNGLKFVTDIDGDREKLAVSSDIKNFAEDSYRKIFVDKRTSVDKDRLTSHIAELVKGVFDNPIPGISFYILKARRAWYGTYSHQREVWALAIQTCYFVLLAFSILKIYRNGLKPRCLLVLSVLIVSYFWFLALLFEPLVRYMVAPMGVLFLLFPAITWKSQRNEEHSDIQ